MRPPINRAMRILDRSFFKKTVPLAAARVFNNQHISQCRQALQNSKDMLKLERGATSIRADPSPEHGGAGKKCVLLREEIKAEGADVAQWYTKEANADFHRQTQRRGAIQYEGL